MSDGTRTLPVSGALLRLASDDRLVEQVRAGSERAFEVAYDRHHRGILAFCRHMLGSVAEAEDAVQHTFMAAFRDLVGSTKPIQLRPWLYTIARNRCLTLMRARREYPVAEVEPPATENLSAEVERRQDLRDLLGDVAGLPDEQRAALVLAEIGALSHEEIAVVIGVPREKVKALVFQARSSLAASRRARETPCTEIRELLANLRGGALRRSTLRRHLRECAGCREFRDVVKVQRRDLALVLPVAPTLALKGAVLGAVFDSGAAGGAAAGGGAFAAKALVAVALVGGGTVAGLEAIRVAAKPDRATVRPAERTPAATNEPVRSAAPPPVSAATVPVAVVEEERAEARPRRRTSPRRTHRSDSPVQGVNRLQSRPEQRSKSRRDEKLHAKRLKREPKVERKLRPARPEKLKRARNERSARRPSAATPTPKAPRKAKRERQPKPVATAAPVAEPTITPDPPEVESEAPEVESEAPEVESESHGTSR